MIRRRDRIWHNARATGSAVHNTSAREEPTPALRTVILPPALMSKWSGWRGLGTPKPEACVSRLRAELAAERRQLARANLGGKAGASLGGGFARGNCRFLVSGGSGIPSPWVERCLDSGRLWLFGRTIFR